MDSSMGGLGDGGTGMAAGVIASPDNAAIEMTATHVASGGIVVKRVVAPADGWLVLRSTVPPGAVMGATHVAQGESRNVVIKVKAAEQARARVALHVDSSKSGQLEFNPARPAASPDKPVIAGGIPVERVVVLRNYGKSVDAISTMLLVQDQTLSSGTARMKYVLLPGPSWISVNLIENGLPGEQIGLMRRGAGESQELLIPLNRTGVTGEVVVTLFADDGVVGRFDYRPDDPLGSRDQPYKAAGVVVSQRVRAR